MADVAQLVERRFVVPVVAGSIPVVRPIPILILAGGRGTRLGGADKALLQAGGRSLAEHLIARLKPQGGQMAISANGDPGRYAFLGLPVLADDVVGRGPLGGVLRGLAWARALGADTLLSVPGDTPFVPHDLAARLGSAPSWAEGPSGLHPLVALWPVACLESLAAWLAGHESGRVRAFGAGIFMRPVWFADAPDPFANVNTPADLAEARARAETERPHG